MRANTHRIQTSANTTETITLRTDVLEYEIMIFTTSSSGERNQRRKRKWNDRVNWESDDILIIAVRDSRPVVKRNRGRQQKRLTDGLGDF